MPPSKRVDSHVHLTRSWPDLAHNSYDPSVDFSVQGLLRELDPHGIDHALVLATFQVPTVSEQLTELEALGRESGGRLRPVVTVDPTRGPEEMASAIEAWSRVPNLAGIKLYPGYLPFYAHDSRLEAVYEYAARRRVPVLLHQGDTMDPNGLVKFSRPVELDEVAVRHRDVSFVLCHLGNPWVEEAAEVVYKNPNVYTDTSGLLASPRVRYFPKMLERARRRVYNAIVTIGSPDRILYGSDWPLESVATAVELIDGLDLPPEDREAILGGNARRLFRIE
jgi:predicted TIM-barrel fold metal-dependent hydrolase